MDFEPAPEQQIEVTGLGPLLEHGCTGRNVSPGRAGEHVVGFQLVHSLKERQGACERTVLVRQRHVDLSSRFGALQLTGMPWDHLVTATLPRQQVATMRHL